jgi:hypothetical protein
MNFNAESLPVFGGWHTMEKNYRIVVKNYPADLAERISAAHAFALMAQHQGKPPATPVDCVPPPVKQKRNAEKPIGNVVS